MKLRFLVSFGLIAVLLVVQAYFIQRGGEFVRIGLLLGGACLVLVGITAWFTVHHIFRPLREISGFIATVSQGDYSATLDEHQPYEMGRVARNLSQTMTTLFEQSNMSQALLENILTPMFFTDTDCRLTWVNENALKLLEYEGKPEDFYGMNLGKFFYHDEGQETLTSKVLQERTRQFSKTQVNTDKGNIRYISICSSPITNYKGELIGVFSTVMDFTNIKLKEDELTAHSQHMAEMADRSADISELLASATGELSTQIIQAARDAEQQGSMTEEVATAMEQMNATVLEVARNSSDASGSARQTGDVAAEGHDVVNEVIRLVTSVAERTAALNQSMSDLSEKADGIGRIIEVINDIADQTNLLALNAAIEAARAGDAGRGFAVVADEVRKLAEKTTQATKDVASNIQDIQNSARQSVEEMHLAEKAVLDSTEKSGIAGEHLQKIVEMVDVSMGQVQEIATATEEQSATSEHITQNIDSIKGIAGETANAMHESQAAVEELSKLAEDLNLLIADMRG
jgi:methyl-accepting chemotaxis protein